MREPQETTTVPGGCMGPDGVTTVPGAYMGPEGRGGRDMPQPAVPASGPR
jgi:hypothetical protein